MSDWLTEFAINCAAVVGTWVLFFHYPEYVRWFADMVWLP